MNVEILIALIVRIHHYVLLHAMQIIMKYVVRVRLFLMFLQQQVCFRFLYFNSSLLMSTLYLSRDHDLSITTQIHHQT